MMTGTGLRRRIAVGMVVAAVAAGGGFAALHASPAAPARTAQAAEALTSGVAASGEGRVQAAPDVAYVNVGVQTQGPRRTRQWAGTARS